MDMTHGFKGHRKLGYTSNYSKSDLSQLFDALQARSMSVSEQCKADQDDIPVLDNRVIDTCHSQSLPSQLTKNEPVYTETETSDVKIETSREQRGNMANRQVVNSIYDEAGNLTYIAYSMSDNCCIDLSMTYEYVGDHLCRSQRVYYVKGEIDYTIDIAYDKAGNILTMQRH